MSRAKHMPDYSWEIDVPLLTNRLIVGATAKIFGFAVLGIAGLLGLALAAQGEWELIPRALLLLSALGGGLFLIGLVLMAVVFRNRWRYRFTITRDGIVAETVDRRLRAANRLAVGAGILLGSPRTLGAGLVGQSQEMQELKWQGRFRAEYLPGAHAVILRGIWRRLMIVYCTVENYAQVAECIRSNIERCGCERRLPDQSPLPRYIGLSVAVILASVPIFLLNSRFGIPLWLPMLLLCFALATLWLVSVFGYVVLGIILMTLGAMAVDAFAMRVSYLHPGETFVRWSVYSGDDWAILSLALIGLAVLGWLASRGIRGNLPAVLSSDMADMGL